MTRRIRQREVRGRSLVGERYDVEVGPVAHGGHCVARHDGRVIFVRHTLPGERVDGARSRTATRSRGSCAATPSRCSRRRPTGSRRRARTPGRGCAAAATSSTSTSPRSAASRRRSCASSCSGSPASTCPSRSRPVPGDTTGCGWRTRLQFAVDPSGRAGLRKHHSHEVVPVDTCPIGHPGLPEVGPRRGPARPPSRRSSRPRGAAPDRRGARADVVRRAAGRPRARRRPGLGGHRIGLLAGASRRGRTPWWTPSSTALAPRPGEHAADLYSGVGLFSAALADRVGETGRVVAVEGDRTAVADAERNLGRPAAGRAPRGPGRPRARPTGRSAAASTWSCWTRPGPARSARSWTRWPTSSRGRWPTSPATPPRWPATWRSSPSAATGSAACVPSTSSR